MHVAIIKNERRLTCEKIGVVHEDRYGAEEANLAECCKSYDRISLARKKFDNNVGRRDGDRIKTLKARYDTGISARRCKVDGNWR